MSRMRGRSPRGARLLAFVALLAAPAVAAPPVAPPRADRAIRAAVPARALVTTRTVGVTREALLSRSSRTAAANAPLPPDTTASTASWLPAVHVTGQSGVFRTDVWVFNPDTDVPAEVWFYLTPAGVDGTNLEGIRLDPPLRPRETVLLADIVPQYFGMDSGFGALQVLSRDVNDPNNLEGPPLLVTSNTYNVAGSIPGTYGQFSPGQPERKALGFDNSVYGDLYLIGLTNDPSLRTNFAIMNPSGKPLEAGAQLVDAVGQTWGSHVYEVPPYSIVQANDVFEKEFVAFGPPHENSPYRLTVWVNIDNGALVLCYASVTDLRTGDPYLITGEPLLRP